MNQEYEKAVVLDNIRSVYNVGSIFRTADALGVGKLYLCGTTPAPTDRFGRKRKDLAKVALGAEDYVEWEYCKDTAEALKKLKKNGFRIIAVEQDKKSVDIENIKMEKNTALVLGNEVGGISEEILGLCDIIAEIPMLGKKESLNVSVSFGISAYIIFKRNG